MNEITSDRFLKLKQVELVAGIKKTKIYQLINAGQFPTPVKLGNASCWSEKEIAQWQAKRVASKNKETKQITQQPQAE